jgi:hypothetical protein
MRPFFLKRVLQRDKVRAQGRVPAFGGKTQLDLPGSQDVWALARKKLYLTIFASGRCVPPEWQGDYEM